jgi:hypothetical protein
LTTAKEDGTSDRALLWEATLAADEQVCSSSPQCADLRGQLPNPVYVVNQSTQPSLSAPLGWTLSQASKNALDRVLQLQNTKTCGPDCQGYASLHDLLARLGIEKTP